MAARRAVSFIFSITYRDAVCRGSPMPPPTRCGVTGLEVAVGGEVPVDAANGRPSLLTWARLIWPLAGATRMRLVQEAGARRGPLSGDPAGLWALHARTHWRLVERQMGDLLFWHKEDRANHICIQDPRQPGSYDDLQLLVLTRNRMSQAKTCLLIY
jgi:hypothetical protein